MSQSVAIVDTGAGNLRSVAKAVEKAGARVSLSDTPESLGKADKVIFPGQGAFPVCMEKLKESHLDEFLVETVKRGTPYFGICLGFQVLFEASSELSETAGLGLLAGRVERISSQVPDSSEAPKVPNAPGQRVRIPHIGWNSVSFAHGHPIFDGIDDNSYFYFAHSYVVHPAEETQVAMWCQYGSPFPAAYANEHLFACQFHPEKSQGVGLRLLENFVSLM